MGQRNSSVDKMGFEVKTWSLQSKKKKKKKKQGLGEESISADTHWSQAEWAARPVVSNSCAPNNKWCIHELQKAKLFGGL